MSTGANSSVTNCRLRQSIVGDDVKLDGLTGVATVGDHSDIKIG